VLRSNEVGEIGVGFIIGYGRLNGGKAMAWRRRAAFGGVARGGARDTGTRCQGGAGWSKTGGAEAVLAGARRVGRPGVDAGGERRHGEKQRGRKGERGT
jgi:hypothetical protein